MKMILGLLRFDSGEIYVNGELVEKQTLVDMLVSNYVYEKVGAKHKKVIHYQNVMPQNKIITWKDMGKFRIGQYILMHSVFYKTSL